MDYIVRMQLVCTGCMSWDTGGVIIRKLIMNTNLLLLHICHYMQLMCRVLVYVHQSPPHPAGFEGPRSRT